MKFCSNFLLYAIVVTVYESFDVPSNHLRGLTALHASSEEVSAYAAELGGGRSDGPSQSNIGESHLLTSPEATALPNTGGGVSAQHVKSSSRSGERVKYPFICECFFMTARVLNLGLLKAFSDFKHLVQVLTELGQSVTD